jgi:hypothetical protein
MHVLAIDLDTVACNDNEVPEWLVEQVDKILGPCRRAPPTHPMATAAPQLQYPHASFPIVENIGAEIGQALELALKKASSPESRSLEASKTDIQLYEG